jgi:hypothetical protein
MLGKSNECHKQNSDSKQSNTHMKAIICTCQHRVAYIIRIYLLINTALNFGSYNFRGAHVHEQDALLHKFEDIMMCCYDGAVPPGKASVCQGDGETR